jgi:protein arginine kinase
MKLIDELSKARTAWFSGSGPMSDIVISSRIRLARNIVGYPFLIKADEGQRRQIYRALFEKISETPLSERVAFVDIDETTELDRQLLVERHLISKQHAEAEGSRGVALSSEETVALMINEEDHLRIQVVGSGLQLERLWDSINRIDDDLQKVASFAFHNQYGFLTACPTNVGTGIRVSVMLHLPALKLTGELEKVSRATRDMRLAVRGMHGEGTEATGDFYQISNQTTLGRSEMEILTSFSSIVARIVDYEKMARDALVQDRTSALDDKIWRALGVLGTSRIISTEECLFLLSHVRMGVHLGRLSDVELNTIDDLFFHTQPAHLQKLTGQVMKGEARGVARADLIRRRLDSHN